jgi:hypothetical protein
MALGNESGDQVGSIHEKNQRSKISWDYPFKQRRFSVASGPKNSHYYLYPTQLGSRWVWNILSVTYSL